MKSNKKTHSSKLNIILVIAALLTLIVTVVTISYSWIETSNSLTIQNGEGKTISANVSNPGVVTIDSSKSDTVSINDYIDNSGSLFLAPARLDGTTLQIKRADGTYSAVTTNDIGNNYIEFDVPFTVAGRYKFSFTADSKISVAESTSNPIRTSLKVDDRKAIVFDSILNKVGTSDRSAFSVQAGSHTLKVRIWLDASTTENETAALNFKGSPVDISLNLVAEEDTSLRKVTISESAHAIVTATYNNGTKDVTITEGNYANLVPGTQVTITAKTADGIVKGSNSALNGYMFKNISTDVAGSSTVLTSTVGSTDTSTHIATTTYTYTVPDNGITDDIVINTDTERETFYIIGPGINENSNWSSPNNTTTLNNYDSVNNCVYGVFTAVGTGNEFKISEKTDNGGTNVGRDSPKYSVSLNSPTVIKSGNITEANLNGQTSPNTNFTYTTSSSDEEILVIYYLEDNEVEIASGSTYVAEYTANARVSTTNSYGTAKVTYGDTAGESVKVPRRAANKQVTFTATPSDSNYRFVGWSTTNGGTSYVSTEAEYTETLSGDLTLHANFKQSHTVLVKAVTGATLSASYTDIYGASQTATNIISDTTINVLDGTKVEITATPTDATGKYLFTWTDSSNAGSPNPSASTFASTSKYTITRIVNDAEISVSLEHYYELKVNLEGTGSYTVDSGEAQNDTYTTYIKDGDSSTITATRTDTDPYKVSWTATGSQTNSKTANLIGSTNTDTYIVSEIGADTTVTIKFERMYTLEVTKTGGDGVTTDLFTISPKVGETALTANEDGKYYVVSGTSVDFDFAPPAEGNYSYTWTVTIGSAPYISGTTPSGVNVTDNTTVALNIAKLTYREVTVKSAAHAIVSASYMSLNGTETIAFNLGKSELIPIGATITVIAKTASGIVTGEENSPLNAHRFAMFNEIIGDNTTQLTGNIENSRSGSGNNETDNFETNKLTYTVTGESTEPITLETMTVNETLYVIGQVNPPQTWDVPADTTNIKMTYVEDGNYYCFSAKATGNNNNEFKISQNGAGVNYRDFKRYSLSYTANLSGTFNPRNSGDPNYNFIFTADSGTDVVIRYYPATNTVDVSNKTYTVAASAGTGGSATVSLNSGAPQSSVTIDRSSTTAPKLVFTATPSSANYQFVNWTDSNNIPVSTDNPYTTTGITSTDTIKANFKGVDRNVSVGDVENADIEVVSPSITEGNSDTVEHGKTITIIASNIASGYSLKNILIKDSNGTVLEQLTPTDNSATYTVQSDINISATLEEKAETRTVYFENTLNWSNVYVNFYSDSYWNTTYGTGSKNITSAANQMSRIAGTNIYQFTYSGSYSTYISFTKDAQAGNEFFHQTSVVYRSDFSVDKPFFIPDTKMKETKNESSYYSNGVWSEYPNSTVSGSKKYYLKGSFNGWNDTNEMVSPSSGSNLVETTVTFEANSSTTFKINNTSDGKWYSNGTGVSTPATYVQFNDNSGDSTFNATEAGKYKFIYNTITNCLTVVKIPD